MESGSANTLSLVLGVYGAVIATLVALWNVYQQVVTYRDRLAVQVVKVDMVQGHMTVGTDKLWIKVTNVGRQPVWLNSVGGRYKRDSPKRYFVIFTGQNLPVKLEPGEAFNDTSSDVDKANLERVRFFCAWDSKDKVHKAPRRQLRDLL
jgi:hypothetical protein